MLGVVVYNEMSRVNRNRPFVQGESKHKTHKLKVPFIETYYILHTAKQNALISIEEKG